ncbi:MAG: AAA family ATPase [Thermoplasmata archaeon]
MANEKRIILSVTGMPGSGKDEFIKVAKNFGFQDYHMGNTVRTYASKNRVFLNDSEIGKFASGERERHGMDVWARRTYDLIGDHKLFIIDGIRNYEEADYFSRNAENFSIIAIFANRMTRLQRILKRNRPDDIHDMEGLIARDNRELNWGIGKVIALSDYMIVNDSTLDEFRRKSTSLIKDIYDRIP